MPTASFDHLQSATYINLTTFRKNGTPVPTPVWFVLDEDGQLYVWTEAESGKVKRLRANGRAQIAPSDSRGNPQGPFVAARGRILADETAAREVLARFRRKYGLLFRAFEVMGRLRGGRRVVLVFEPVDEPAETNQPGGVA